MDRYGHEWEEQAQDDQQNLCPSEPPLRNAQFASPATTRPCVLKPAVAAWGASLGQSRLSRDDIAAYPGIAAHHDGAPATVLTDVVAHAERTSQRL
jgi:hypothetical protein